MKEVSNLDYTITREYDGVWLHYNDRKLKLHSGSRDNIRLYTQGNDLCVYGWYSSTAYYYIEVYDYNTLERIGELFKNDYELPELLGGEHAAKLFEGNEYITQARKLYNIIKER